MADRIEYTQRDFESIRQALVALIPTKTDRWTDFSESDVGIALLELTAAVGDQLSFYLDQAANEAFLPTARQRRNVINLCKLIAYRLEHIVSATTQVEFSIQSAWPHRIDIPKFTQIGVTSSGETIKFATTDFVSIPAGDTSVLVGAKQGTLKVDDFTTTGLVNQRFRLSETDVDVLSIEVTIDGILWVVAESFVNAQGSDRVYLVEVDADNNVEVLLGDGFFGLSPSLSSTPNVQVRYLISVGDDGNLGANTIKTLFDDIFDTQGNEVSISVVNTQSSTGGATQESIEKARKQAPAQLSALYRAMTKGDYIALVEGFPGIAKAMAWGEQDEAPPDYDLYNWVLIAAAPDGVTRAQLIDDPENGILSDTLKDNLRTYLEQRKCITTRVKVIDPVYVPIDLEATIFYTKGSLPSVVKSQVEEAVVDFLSFEEVGFGREVRKSNLYRIMDSVSGVEYLELDEFKTTTTPGGTDVEEVVILKKYELPYLRTLTIHVEAALDTPARAGLYPTPPAQPAPVD